VNSVDPSGLDGDNGGWYVDPYSGESVWIAGYDEWGGTTYGNDPTQSLLGGASGLSASGADMLALHPGEKFQQGNKIPPETLAGKVTPLPIYCQPDVIAAMKRAWARTQN